MTQYDNTASERCSARRTITIRKSKLVWSSTVLYILYTMVQQTNLLPKNASRNGAIFAQKVYQIYATTSQYLSSYGCTIIMVYIIIYNFTLPCINANVYQSSITERLHTLCHTNNTVILYDIHTYPNNLYKYWLHNLA